MEKCILCEEYSERTCKICHCCEACCNCEDEQGLDIEIQKIEIIKD